MHPSLLASALVSLSLLQAQAPVPTPTPLPTQTQAQAGKPLQFGATRTGKRTDDAMNAWREHRIGQFIHFGLYSMLGGSWNGKVYPGAAEWIAKGARIPKADYEALARTFQPDPQAPQRWARLAKDMGARYVILTTKHHDGFCLWPSAHSDFTVAATPTRTDLLDAYVKACEAEGLEVVLYYSILDWHHPDWRYRIKDASDQAAFERYWAFATAQLEELLKRHPKVIGLWFDGTWDESVKKNGRLTFELDQRLRKLRPGLVIGSRLHADDFGKRGFDSNGRLMGDYEQGWERKLPDQVLANDWECVMTIPENQWGYHAHWTGHIKDFPELLEMAVRSVALGGNFVMNIGPRGDGSIRPEEQALVTRFGAWMKVHGEVMYGCGPSGLPRQDWGWMTRKPGSDRIHAVVFNVPLSGRLVLDLPKDTAPRMATWNGTSLKVTHDQGGRYLIHLPKTRHTEPFVITVELGRQIQRAAEEALT